MNSSNFALLVLEAGTPDQGASMVGRGPCSGSQTSYILTGQKGKGALLSLFYSDTDLILFMRVLPSRPSHLPKAPPPTVIRLGIRISAYELWENINVQTITIAISKNWANTPHIHTHTQRRQKSKVTKCIEFRIAWLGPWLSFTTYQFWTSLQTPSCISKWG